MTVILPGRYPVLKYDRTRCGAEPDEPCTTRGGHPIHDSGKVHKNRWVEKIDYEASWYELPSDAPKWLQERYGNGEEE